MARKKGASTVVGRATLRVEADLTNALRGLNQSLTSLRRVKAQADQTEQSFGRLRGSATAAAAAMAKASATVSANAGTAATNLTAMATAAASARTSLNGWNTAGINRVGTAAANGSQGLRTLATAAQTAAANVQLAVQSMQSARSTMSGLGRTANQAGGTVLSGFPTGSAAPPVPPPAKFFGPALPPGFNITGLSSMQIGPSPAQAAGQAQQSAAAYIAGLKQVYALQMGAARDLLVRGQIKPAQYQAMGQQAARAYNAGLTAEIDRRAAAGNLRPGDYTRLTGELRNANTGTKNLNTSVGSLGRTFSMGNVAAIAFGNVLGGAVFRAVHLVASTITGSVKELLAFHDAMVKVSTIADPARTNLALLEQQILNLSRTTRQSATDLAEGLYEILQSGFENGPDAQRVLEASARAATAGYGELKTVAAGLTNIMNAYGLKASQAEYVSDIMFRTVDKGRISLEGVANEFGKVVTSARQANVSLEEVAASMSTMTIMGIKPAESASSINRFIVGLNKVTEAQKRAAKDLGKKSGMPDFEISQAAMAKAGGFVQYLRQIMQVTGGVQAKLSALFPNMREFRSLSILAGEQGAAVYARHLQAMKSAQGATAVAAEKANKSFAAQWDLFKNKLFSVWQGAAAGSLPVLAEALQGINNLLSTGLERQITQLRQIGAMRAALRMESVKMAQDMRNLQQQGRALELQGSQAANRAGATTMGRLGDRFLQFMTPQAGESWGRRMARGYLNTVTSLVPGAMAGRATLEDAGRAARASGQIGRVDYTQQKNLAALERRVQEGVARQERLAREGKQLPAREAERLSRDQEAMLQLQGGREIRETATRNLRRATLGIEEAGRVEEQTVASLNTHADAQKRVNDLTSQALQIQQQRRAALSRGRAGQADADRLSVDLEKINEQMNVAARRSETLKQMEDSVSDQADGYTPPGRERRGRSTAGSENRLEELGAEQRMLAEINNAYRTFYGTVDQLPTELEKLANEYMEQERRAQSATELMEKLKKAGRLTPDLRGYGVAAVQAARNYQADLMRQMTAGGPDMLLDKRAVEARDALRDQNREYADQVAVLREVGITATDFIRNVHNLPEPIKTHLADIGRVMREIEATNKRIQDAKRKGLATTDPDLVQAEANVTRLEEEKKRLVKQGQTLVQPAITKIVQSFKFDTSQMGQIPQAGLPILERIDALVRSLNGRNLQADLYERTGRTKEGQAERRAASQDLKALEEAYTAMLRSLEPAFRSGEMSAEDYAEVVDHIRQRMAGATEATKKLSRVPQALQDIGRAAGKIGAIAAGLGEVLDAFPNAFGAGQERVKGALTGITNLTGGLEALGKGKITEGVVGVTRGLVGIGKSIFGGKSEEQKAAEKESQQALRELTRALLDLKEAVLDNVSSEQVQEDWDRIQSALDEAKDGRINNGELLRAGDGTGVGRYGNLLGIAERMGIKGKTEEETINLLRKELEEMGNRYGVDLARFVGDGQRRSKSTDPMGLINALRTLDPELANQLSRLGQPDMKSYGSVRDATDFGQRALGQDDSLVAFGEFIQMLKKSTLNLGEFGKYADEIAQLDPSDPDFIEKRDAIVAQAYAAYQARGASQAGDLTGTDVKDLIERMKSATPKELDASHNNAQKNYENMTALQANRLLGYASEDNRLARAQLDEIRAIRATLTRNGGSLPLPPVTPTVVQMAPTAAMTEALGASQRGGGVNITLESLAATLDVSDVLRDFDRPQTQQLVGKSLLDEMRKALLQQGQNLPNGSRIVMEVIKGQR